MRNLLVLLFFSLCLIGCVHELPILSSGTVSELRLPPNEVSIRRNSKSWTLSKSQLEKLSLWLKYHESEWGIITATPPGPSYSILLTHSDGSHTGMELFSVNESWKHAVHIDHSDPTGKPAYSGGLNLSTEDMSRFKQILSDDQ
jgi:hypothetical protein